MRAVEWAVEHYLSQGVTTTVIAGGDRRRFGDLQEARRRGLLKFRIATMLSKGAAGRESVAEAGALLSGFGDDWLRLGAIKSWHDGSNQGFTGYFSVPYHTPFKGDATYRGYPSRTREELAALVKELHDAGYQIAIHGNGDAAIDDILFAYEQAQQANPRPDARHRIEHCQYVREDQLDKIAQLGVTPSFFVGHVYYWGDRHRDIFLGPERAARISPLESARRRGIRFTVHDDTPVTPVDPLQLVWVSVNRTMKSGEVLGADQRITVEQALRAVTLDAAWQNHEEDRKGSIEVGKLADFTVLEENPAEAPPENIRDIRILRTVVGGRTVWKQP
jgi:predicted amidohydrolase YtcJ